VAIFPGLPLIAEGFLGTMDWRNREIWVLRQMGEMETRHARPLRPFGGFSSRSLRLKSFAFISRENPKTLTAKNFREVRKEI